MPWTGEPGHGFTNGRPWLRLGDDADTRNVAAQETDPGSVLATYRRLIDHRRHSEALRSGTLRVVENGTSDVLAWSREAAGERILVVVNFTDAPRETRVNDGDGTTYRALVGSHLDPASPTPSGELSLRPLEAVVLRAG
jgi:alpha-glucosidase